MKKKGLAVLLIISMLLGISGCSAFGGKSSKKEDEPAVQPSHRWSYPRFLLHGYRLRDITDDHQGRHHIRYRNWFHYIDDQVFRFISGRRELRYPDHELGGSAPEQVVPSEKIREGIGYGSKIQSSEYGPVPYLGLPGLFGAPWRNVRPYGRAYRQDER